MNVARWEQALREVSAVADESVGSAVVSLRQWDEADMGGVHAQTLEQCARVLLPAAHMAVLVPSSQVDIAGLTLRLARCEIRDTISVLTADTTWYWLLARKDSDMTVLASVAKYGTGAINIDASRVPGDVGTGNWSGKTKSTSYDGGWDWTKKTNVAPNSEGRFPPNVLLTDEAAREVDTQMPDAGGSGPASGPTQWGPHKSSSMAGAFKGTSEPPRFYGDAGGASRFFPRVGEDLGREWVTTLIRVPIQDHLAIDEDGHVAVEEAWAEKTTSEMATIEPTATMEAVGG